ncbi:hypothetical protein HMPREF1544_10956 [Mucor circinelloides 1006PhL]|uniref:Uncharacterized protein n=1 Tax=Mucor circinelloides f. circinelloides (strain 1006PhL) TaxID=1220926 RepID=S2IX49_MUCC1|nr:hypothetical protein HMPREF1544_10956 [Mucor circinelloides 1006PhL]
MTKRRLDNDDFVNSLRQKHKEDPQLKQQAARNTFAMLMRAQQSPTTPTADPGPSYQYFNNSNTALPATLHTTNAITASIFYAKHVYSNAIHVNTYTVPPVRISTILNLQIKCFVCRVHKADD